VAHVFNEEELYDMDRYLWLDFMIESLWTYYTTTYMGKYEITDEEEEEIISIMGTIYALEESIIDLLSGGLIDFSMITTYKDINNVSNWPTRFC
jgi:hypothetical protein